MADPTDDKALTDGMLFKEINDLRQAPPLEDEDDLANLKFDSSTFCGRLAQNKFFEYATLGVIVLNALYLGYDCDYSTRWGKPEALYESSLWGFILWDNFFCAFFSFEVAVRFLGYRVKSDSCKDISFLFDFSLVFLMVIETWILAFLGPIEALKQVSILRLLRLTRLLRMGKILRYLPELQLIVKGMLAAVRSVSCAGVLLMLCLYVFAIIFTSEYHQGLKADDDVDLEPIEALFGGMGKSMRHLLIMATILDDITACTNAIRSTDNMVMLMAFMVCVVISSFTLFNMLIGILCEVMQATSDHERSSTAQTQISEVMLAFFATMDVNGDGNISAPEFIRMRDHPEVMASLAKLDIENAEFIKYAELLFAPKTEGDKPRSLQYQDAVAMIMRLRPGTPMNKLDFVRFKQEITKDSRKMHARLHEISELLDEIDQAKADGLEQDAEEKMMIIRAATHMGDKDDDDEPERSEEAEDKLRRIQASMASGGGKRTKHRKPLSKHAASGIGELARPPPIKSQWQEATDPSNPTFSLVERPTADGENPERIQRLVDTGDQLRRFHSSSSEGHAILGIHRNAKETILEASLMSAVLNNSVDEESDDSWEDDRLPTLLD